MSGKEDGCQLGGSEHTLRSLPWADDSRGDKKTELLEYAREHSDGFIIGEAYKTVFEKKSTTADADYKLANRFYSSYNEYFKIDRRDRHKWVEPRLAAFHLTTSKHSSKLHHSTDIAKSNAEGALSRRRKFTNDASKGVVLGALAAKRSATDNKYLILQNTENKDSHLMTKYRTRFNSPARVSQAIARYHTAWEIAAAEYDRGVLLTLTTDPSRYDSIADASEDLMDDLNRLKSWLANRFFDGQRPPNIAVPEFTQKGMPHLHVAVFGVGFLPHGAIEHYWDQRRDRAEHVWVDSMFTRGGQWRWQASPKHTDARSPQLYLSKDLHRLKSLAAADADCVKEAASWLRSDQTREDDEAHEWWHLACRWALGVKLFTCSPSLTRGHDQGTSSESERAPQWRFVSASRYGTIPGHILREHFSAASEWISKPPPL